MIHYIFCFYRESNLERNIEIEEAISTNLKSEYIESATIVLENCDLPDFVECYRQKLQIIRRSDRAKFSDLFKLFKEKHHNIIANNDIIFEFSMFARLNLNLIRNTCLCLTRWELDGSLFHENIGDSQDTWIFGSNLNKKAIQGLGEYYLGVLGCDNRLLYELYSFNIPLMNIPYLYRTVHNHQSRVRNYNESSRLSGWQFWLKPTSFLEACLVARLLLIKSHRITKWLKEHRNIYYFDR